MQYSFELEGGNFSKAGYASSQIKKVLKQLSIDSRIIKRIVVALYEAVGKYLPRWMPKRSPCY